ncbi:MAG: ABC transporter ATP-binding protein, partial [Coriobacteriales bacterium]|nr:ABC transporter ATP-binding protein [Coriobacteriales bacterium]
MANSAICFKEVSKLYGKGESATYALRDASFSVEGGSFVVVLGPSGAGKTTLLNLLGGMDSATSGAIMVDDTDICRLSERELTAFRAQQIGYIFQFYNLIPTLTAAENIELMRSVKSDSLAASQVLEEVGLAGHERKFPSQLSGGEQQRVSIARAIAKRPRLLLCDEPTGALDSATGVRVLKLLRQQADSGQTTVLVVTHNAQIAQIADVAIKVRDGRVESL